MKRREFTAHFPRNVFLMMGLLVLLIVALLPLMLTREAEASLKQTPLPQSPLGSAPSLRVEPPIAIFPATRERDGVWFLGSGLQPGQGVYLVVPSGSFNYNLTWGELDDPLVVDDEGAFAASMEVRPRQSGYLWTDRNTILLKDADTGQVIASAPLIFCFPTEEGSEDDPSPWCDTAAPLLDR